MARKTNTFNIGDNVTPDSTNTAATGDPVQFGTPTGSVTYKAVTTGALEGQSLSVTGAAGTAQTMFFSQAANLQGYGQIYVYLPASGGRPTTADLSFWDIRNASAGVVKLLLTTAGLLRIQTGSGGGLKTFNSGAAYAAGWYCIDTILNLNSAAGADDTVTCNVYSMATGALASDGTFTTSTATLSATGMTTMRWGKIDTAPAITGLLLDRPSFDVGTLTPPALYTAPSPPSGTTGYNRRIWTGSTWA